MLYSRRRAALRFAHPDSLDRAAALPPMPRRPRVSLPPRHERDLPRLRPTLRARARILRGRHVRQLRPGDPRLSGLRGRSEASFARLVRAGDPGAGRADIRSLGTAPVPIFPGDLDAPRPGGGSGGVGTGPADSQIVRWTISSRLPLGSSKKTAK